MILTSAFSFMLVNVYYYINVNLKNKSMIKELASLFLYIVLISLTYIFLNEEMSIISLIIKFLTIVFYSFILAKIFKINLTIFRVNFKKITSKF